MTDSRHFFVVDENGDKVGAFDISSERKRKHIIDQLPDDLNVDPIRIPDHAEGREQALEQITEATIDWDGRISYL